jgi:hypothetical protein
MKVYEDYTNHLVEFRQNRHPYNAPMFIYKILTKKEPPQMMGRGCAHPSNIINNIPIDKAIPKKVMSGIMNINGIETRSSCQGEDATHPTFLILRLKDGSKTKVDKFVKYINSNEKYICGADIGSEGQYRIGITGFLWYNNKNEKEFTDWWTGLEKILKNYSY